MRRLAFLALVIVVAVGASVWTRARVSEACPATAAATRLEPAVTAAGGRGYPEWPPADLGEAEMPVVAAGTPFVSACSACRSCRWASSLDPRGRAGWRRIPTAAPRRPRDARRAATSDGG